MDGEIYLDVKLTAKFHCFRKIITFVSKVEPIQFAEFLIDDYPPSAVFKVLLSHLAKYTFFTVSAFSSNIGICYFFCRLSISILIRSGLMHLFWFVTTEDSVSLFRCLLSNHVYNLLSIIISIPVQKSVTIFDFFVAFSMVFYVSHCFIIFINFANNFN